MNIRQAAELSGLPVKTVRFYDEIELVSPERASNGYRDYNANEVHKLKFLNRARSLGFSLDDCRQLLSLYEDQNRTSASVKEIAQVKINDIDIKLAELKSMRATLKTLVNSCHGDSRPDCPILEELGR
ncbi:MAG: Cu(I)-responsive transcriptional regulator [Pseudomonadota bacterium]